MGQSTPDTKATVTELSVKELTTLLHLATHSRKCARPECRKKFLSSKTKKRYCSSKCSKLITASHKRRWWTVHGREWRRRRNELRELQNHPVGG